jgi:hypothetical protein
MVSPFKRLGQETNLRALRVEVVVSGDDDLEPTLEDIVDDLGVSHELTGNADRLVERDANELVALLAVLGALLVDLDERAIGQDAVLPDGV